MKVLGIYRETIFSPGKVEDDRQVMDKALEELGRFGVDTEAVSPESIPGVCMADIVLSMAQSMKTLSFLRKWEENGIRIINSISSIMNCYRYNMMRLLEECEIPIPKSWVYSIEAAENELAQIHLSDWIGTYWIKRGDFHAIDSADVVKVASFEEMRETLSNFREKGVNQVIIQEHKEGKVVKFYGVGNEYIKAFLLPENQEVNLNQGIKDIILKATRCLGLEIYGGDLIIEANGDVLIIDINDWPSFSLCQDEAEKKIATYTKSIMEEIK